MKVARFQKYILSDSIEFQNRPKRVVLFGDSPSLVGVILGGGEGIDWKGAHGDFWGVSDTPCISRVISIICVLVCMYRGRQGEA